jgi:large subunit ribosomal protein L17
MRHAVRGRKLGRTTSHREALFRNQLQSLMDKERIVTTLPKAKELRPLAERVITRGKQGTVHARRWALRWLLRRDLVKKLFDEIAPRFSARPGGYLRIVKLGPRLGDGAEMAVIEMVDRVAPEKGAADAKSEKSEKAAAKRGAKPGKAAAKEPAKRAAGKGKGKAEEGEKADAEERAGKPEKKAAKTGKAGKQAEAHPPVAEGGRGHGDGKRAKPTTPRPGGRKPSTPQKTG